MKDGYFYTICIAFVAGVLLATFFALPIHTLIVAGVSSFAVFIFAQFISREKISGIIFVSLALLSFSLGALRYQHVSVLAPIPELQSSLNKKITVEGTILEEPEETATDVRFAIAPDAVQGVNVKNVGTKILVTVGLHDGVAYGDEVKLTGKITLPQNFMTDGGGEFDYVSYLAKDDIGYMMKNPKVEIVSHGNGSKIISALLFIKHAFATSLDRALPSPEDLFANGLLIGTRSAFPQTLTDEFVRTGTIHMVALSGYNVTIVVNSIMQLVAFLPIAVASGIGIISIILFALLVGGTSTVIRASIMASLLVLSKYIGRAYDVARALILAGTVMIAINPKILVFDTSFQLSFMATLGMLYLSPKVSHVLRFLPERFGIREIASGTLSAELAVFPLIVYHTGILSLVSIPTNMLVLPLVPITMLFGFLTGGIGLLSGIIASPFAFISYGLLHYELAVVHWFASLPFAALTIQNVPIIFILGFYGVLAWWVMRPEIKKPL